MRHSLIAIALMTSAACASTGTTSSSLPFNAESDRTQTVDHYVRVRSTAPSMSGQMAQLYVRERASGRTVARGGAGVVLFVHGAGTPAEVAFDVPYADYSWMGFLANAGFDVFSMDMTGYGRSTRPTVMNDPCNLARNQQTQFVPALMPQPCAQTYNDYVTTIGSDWNDIDAVVTYIRALRHVDKLNLVGWSQGGPRAGGYTAQHPDRVQRLVLLAPAYNRNMPDAQAPRGSNAVVFNTQSHQEFVANWDRQVGCPEQYDIGASDSVWGQMLDSDPVGRTWGTGVRRAPTVPSWGWNQAAVSRTQTPILMVAGVHDKQVDPARVRELYMDMGSREKVFIDLGCSSHNAMWERNHTILFKTSLEWLSQGTVDGKKEGMLKLGYPIEP